MVLNYSIKDLHEGLTKKKFSSVDLVKESFATIEKINPKVNACITTRLKKDAIEEAKKCDKERHDDSPILFGIPFVMKDSYITK